MYLNSVRGQVAEQKDRARALEIELGRAQIERDRAKGALSAYHDECVALQREKDEALAERREATTRLEAELENWKQSALGNDVAKYRRRCEAAEERLASIRAENAELTSRAEAAEERAAGLAVEQDKARNESRLQMREHDTIVAHLRSKVSSEADEVTDLRRRLLAAEEALAEASELRRQLSEQTRRGQTLASEKTRLQEVAEAAQAEKLHADTAFESLSATATELRKELTAKELQCAELGTARKLLAAQFETLEEER